METRREFLTTMGLGIAGATAGNQFPGGPDAAVPALEFAFTATVTLGTVQPVGDVPHGNRRIIPITGGKFEGPAIKGTVEPGGADWQVVRTDNVAELDARYTLKTDDGVLIYIVNRGYRHGPAEVLQRLAKGEEVDPKEYYFRTAANFETASEKYDYLNKHVYVATGERRRDRVIIHFYKIL